MKFFNYGTVLQLFAVQEAVRSLGYKYEVIDYAPSHPAHENLVQRVIRRVPEFIRNPSDAAQALFLKGVMRHPGRSKKFRNFLQNHLQIGGKIFRSCGDLRSDLPSYDAFLCGSDQIWNPRCYGNDPTFFLAFAPPCQRVSYAPSIGLSSIPDHHKKAMKDLLDGVAHLSVREKRGAQIIKELTGREAKVVLDPTLLLTPEKWSEIASPWNRNGSYIFCYFLESDFYSRKIVSQLARQMNYDVVFLLLNYRDLFNNSIIKKIDVGPEEFLGLIKNASLVCTDSFHATVFSILFKKPFYAFRRYLGNAPGQTFSRIENLLDTVNLSSQIIGKDMKIPNDPLIIDFCNANRSLNAEIKTSMEYLKNALRSATGEKGDE